MIPNVQTNEYVLQLPRPTILIYVELVIVIESG